MQGGQAVPASVVRVGTSLKEPLGAVEMACSDRPEEGCRAILRRGLVDRRAASDSAFMPIASDSPSATTPRTTGQRRTGERNATER